MKREMSRFLAHAARAVRKFTAAVVFGPVGIHVKRTRVMEADARIQPDRGRRRRPDAAADVTHQDEIGTLGCGFDELLARIHDPDRAISSAPRTAWPWARARSRGQRHARRRCRRRAAHSEEIASTLHELSDRRSAVRRSARREPDMLDALDDRRARQRRHAAPREVMAGLRIVAAHRDDRPDGRGDCRRTCCHQRRRRGCGRARTWLRDRTLEVRGLAKHGRCRARDSPTDRREHAPHTGEMNGEHRAGRRAASGSRVVHPATLGPHPGVRGTRTRSRRPARRAQSPMAEIDRSVQGNSAVAEESAAVAATLTERSRELQALVGSSA